VTCDGAHIHYCALGLEQFGKERLAHIHSTKHIGAEHGLADVKIGLGGWAKHSCKTGRRSTALVGCVYVPRPALLKRKSNPQPSSFLATASWHNATLAGSSTLSTTHSMPSSLRSEILSSVLPVANTARPRRLSSTARACPMPPGLHLHHVSVSPGDGTRCAHPVMSAVLMSVGVLASVKAIGSWAEVEAVYFEGELRYLIYQW
jgi:hypothetical protein